jgi:hypothetical protein
MDRRQTPASGIPRRFARWSPHAILYPSLLVLSVVVLGSVAVCACGGSSATGASPSGSAGPESAASTLPGLSVAAPTRLGSHRHTSVELQAMAMAQATVDQGRWAYDTSRYSGQAPDIVGYVVEWQRPGVALVATVESPSGRTVMWGAGAADGRPAGLALFCMDGDAWKEWTPKVRSSDAENWALTTAGEALCGHGDAGTASAWLPTGDPLVAAYVVGWPGVHRDGGGLTLLVPADLRHDVIAPWGPEKW